MPSTPLNSPLSLAPPPGSAPDLLSRAALLLAVEVLRLPRSPSREKPDALPSVAPFEGAELPAAASAPGDLIEKALASSNADELRRHSSQLLETFLASVAQQKGANSSSTDEQVPLIRCAARVAPGTAARATIRVANEEMTPTVVSFYGTNFVADSGYELASLLVSVTPRSARLPPGGEASFEIEIAVPAQAPAGLYSGLLQATGCKYVKAVVLLEVL